MKQPSDATAAFNLMQGDSDEMYDLAVSLTQARRPDSSCGWARPIMAGP